MQSIFPPLCWGCSNVSCKIFWAKANCFASEADLKTGSLFSRKIQKRPIEFFKVVGYLPNGTNCGIWCLSCVSLDYFLGGEFHLQYKYPTFMVLSYKWIYYNHPYTTSNNQSDSAAHPTLCPNKLLSMAASTNTLPTKSLLSLNFDRLYGWIPKLDRCHTIKTILSLKRLHCKLQLG